MLVIDNGPQYDSAELFAFARSWCFEKVTSSPKLPESIQGVSSATWMGPNDNGGIRDYFYATVYGTLQQNSVTNQKHAFKAQIWDQRGRTGIEQVEERQQRQSHEADHTLRDSSYKNFRKDYLASMHLHWKTWQQELHGESW